MEPSFKLKLGCPFPLGVCPCEEGVNFAIESSSAKKLALCLFDSPDSRDPICEIQFDPEINRTESTWHIFVEHLPQHYFYLFKVDDAAPMLLDPYAHGVATPNRWGDISRLPYFPLGIISPAKEFNWEDDKPPKIPSCDLIVYEMHVRGFTQHPSSKVNHPGTFLGMIEKIPYLVELGINAVELLPIQEFDELENPRVNPVTLDRLYNYWGYSTVNFFSLMRRYTSSPDASSAVEEFKMLVKALHANNIEVILDVVFNHTAEAGKDGPTLSFKGLDLESYYHLDENKKHLDFTGCGNTFNCNSPLVTEYIVDCLRYWVLEMHVDGFRFDLASVLTRGTDGQPLSNPPLVEAISFDPVISQVKLIAEAWDAAGLYQVGSFFSEYGWSDWNGKYRDNVREFIKGTGNKNEFCKSLCGSQDLYGKWSPSRSINFVTVHDGFTLTDLVSYNHKHNIVNGENNRDGLNYNSSWNCGVEGITRDKNILALRERQKRNFFLALMVSRGIPMLLMGDEYGHTKRGNNNTWCQDNELNWFLWDHLESSKEFYRFYRKLIQFRKSHCVLRANVFLENEEVEWHGRELGKVDWSNPFDGFIAYTLKDLEEGHDLYIAFNATPKPVIIELPLNTDSKKWHWVVNTASPSPYDFREEGSYTATTDSHYRMVPFSAILLQCLPVF